MKDIKTMYQEEMKNSYNAISNTNWKSKDVYAEWLAQTYFYAVFTTRIISLAGALFPIDRNELHLRFLDHTREEKNHEKILISDLKELGYGLDEFKPSISATCLYQTQYYFIQNVSPMSVYGYFFYLEGLAVEYGPLVLKKLSGSHPEKSLKYLKVHAEEDKGHVQEHFDFLGAATKTELIQMQNNLIQTAQLYQNMMSEIAGKYQKSQAA